MTNEQVAKHLSEMIFNNNDVESTKLSVQNFAVQIFVEAAVIPEDCDTYTMEQLEKKIKKFLDDRI